MLTFEFTGVGGEMTVSDRITSGLVGKEVQLSFSGEWDGLTITAVFVAGEVCRTAEWTGSAVTIPEEVLYRPFQRLLVGACGTNSDGTQVIPTILAEGPLIELGATPTDDPTAVDLPVWKDLQNQIDALKGASGGTSGGSGGVFVPAVSDSGDLSWTNNCGMENPKTVNIMGENGFSIYAVDATIGSGGLLNYISVKHTAVESNGRTVQVGDFLLTTNGKLTKVTEVTSSTITATHLMDVCPVRGTDYWTEEDIAEIKSYVDEAILSGAW